MAHTHSVVTGWLQSHYLGAICMCQWYTNKRFLTWNVHIVRSKQRRVTRRAWRETHFIGVHLDLTRLRRGVARSILELAGSNHNNILRARGLWSTAALIHWTDGRDLKWNPFLSERGSNGWGKRSTKETAANQQSSFDDSRWPWHAVYMYILT